MKQNVMFVDDEKNVLMSIKRHLHTGDFNLFTAEDGMEGLRILSETPMHVVVTDMRMPVMDGIRFLKEARPICPDAVFMVLSGYADMEYVMEAVNTHHVWRYIIKPWQDDDLRMAVNNALDLVAYKIREKRLLAELSEKNEKLEALNSVLEEKVMERTHALRARNEILQMMIEDTEFGKIIRRICSEMAKDCGMECLFVDVPFMDDIFSNQSDCKPSGDLVRLAGKSRRTKAEIADDNGCAIPLLRNGVLLGMCLFHAGTLSGHSMEGWLSLLTLCLIQAKSMKESPMLVESINQILGAL